jgi:ribonuclease D
MALQYKFFIIPIRTGAEAESELNRFLRSARVVTTHQEFVVQGKNSFWCMAVEYLSDGSPQSYSENAATGGRIKPDYRELLSPENFAIFAKLREWRKEIAGKEAVPVYTIFTNEQLAKIAEKRITAKTGLQEIEGIGEARIKKYGDAVIAVMVQEVKSDEQKPKDETHSRTELETPSGMKTQEQKNEAKERPVLFDSESGKSSSGIPQSRQR